MKHQAFSIVGILPGYNEYLNAAKGPFGAKEYTRLKKSTQAIVWFYARKARIQPITNPVRVSIQWQEPNRRRDPDNVQSGVKEIFDSLRDMGVLKNDGWKWITGIEQTVVHCPDQPGVLVQLYEAEGE